MAGTLDDAVTALRGVPQSRVRQAYNAITSSISNGLKNIFSKAPKNRNLPTTAADNTPATRIANAVNNDPPEKVARELEEMASAVETSKLTPGTAPTPQKAPTNTPGDNLNVRKTWYNNKFTNALANNPGKTFVGVSTTTMLAYAGLYVDNTDGLTVNISTITIDTDNNYAIIEYTRPNSFYKPSVGDTVSFSTNCNLGALDVPISEIINISGTTQRFKVDISSMATQPPSGPMSPPATGTRTFIVHADFGNQFASVLSDFTSGVVRTIADVAGIAIDAAADLTADALNAALRGLSQVAPIIGDSLVTVIDAAGGAAGAAAGAAGGAAKKGLCALVPILCNSTILWLLLFLIVGGVLFSIVSTKKGGGS